MKKRQMREIRHPVHFKMHQIDICTGRKELWVLYVEHSVSLYKGSAVLCVLLQSDFPFSLCFGSASWQNLSGVLFPCGPTTHLNPSKRKCGIIKGSPHIGGHPFMPQKQLLTGTPQRWREKNVIRFSGAS